MARPLLLLLVLFTPSLVAQEEIATFVGNDFYDVFGPPDSISVGDIDGDSDLDIVAGRVCCDNEFTVLLNNGKGSYSSAGKYFAFGSPTFTALGDLDGDGDLEIVVTDFDFDRVRVYDNQGNANFVPNGNYDAGFIPHSVVLKDLDGDRDVDMASVNFSDVYVWFNNGEGVFGAETRYAVGATSTWLAAGDLDGDSDFDLVTSNFGSDDISILRNVGDGTFEAPVSYRAGRPSKLALGDLDGDSDLDVVTVNLSTESFTVLLNHGDGTFADGVNYGVERTINQHFALGDVNGDKWLDVIVPNTSSGGASVYFNDGTGEFDRISFFGASANGLNSSTSSVALGDVNGDSVVDLISGGHDFYVHVSFGAHSFNGDVNRDGQVDLLDVGPFVDLLINQSTQVEADINQDGFVNLLDVGPFVDLLSGI